MRGIKLYTIGETAAIGATSVSTVQSWMQYPQSTQLFAGEVVHSEATLESLNSP